ncbi:MAG: 5' nucleotidase, NT5C type [Desulfurivibrionaceae bacterium]
MHIHPSRIGFDIDGVVADTMEAFIRLARTGYGAKVRPEEITEFQVEDCLDIDPLVVEEIFSRLLEEPIACGLRLMTHARRVLTGFAAHGPLTFITARPQKKPIARWLKKELGPQVYGRVRLVATGEHDGKADPIKEMGLAFFVDDRAQTCLQLANEEGIQPIVYRQAWNQGRHALPEVENWRTIHALCFGEGAW